MDAKRNATPTEGLDVDMGRPGHLLEEAGATFKDGRRASHASACQQRGEDGIARRFGGRESLPVGQSLYPGLGHRDMVVDGKTDRVG